MDMFPADADNTNYADGAVYQYKTKLGFIAYPLEKVYFKDYASDRDESFSLR